MRGFVALLHYCIKKCVEWGKVTSHAPPMHRKRSKKDSRKNFAKLLRIS